jgi:hypothetical protein
MLATAMADAALARDWHVSPDGNDANDGTSPARALRTLQKAESVVAPGDVVLLGDGVYEGDMSKNRPGTALLRISKSGRPDAWITFKARPGHKPVLRPREWTGIEIHGSYIVIEGLTVIGANDELNLKAALEAAKLPDKQARFNTNGIYVNGRPQPPEAKPHHVVIRNNSVSKMPGGGILAIEADHITIEDNRVFENAWYMEYAGSGITLLNNWAYDDAPGYHVIIRRNLVWNNKTMVPWGRTGKLSDGNGILLDVTDQQTTGGATNPNGDAVVTEGAAPAKPPRPVWKGRALIANNVSAFNGGSGIHTFRTAHVDIINNTTYWNGSVVGYEEMFPNRSDDVVFLNNVIVPRPGGKVTSNNRSTNIRWDYNLYPVEQSVLRGPHDIVADPGLIDPFIDVRRGDFRLAKGSPAIGSGTDDVPQPDDVTGAKRPVGKRDRGAYEQ